MRSPAPGQLVEGFRQSGQIDPDGAIMRAFLGQALAHPELLRAVWHPLGFIHILIGSVDELRARLHIWTRNSLMRASTNWPIHDHIWTLHSRVLAGTIENRIYDVQDDLRSASHRVYHVAHRAEDAILEPSDQLVQCTLASSTTYRAGEQYAVPSLRFHSSKVELEIEPVVGTCVLAGDSRCGIPRLLGPIEVVGDKLDVRVACDSDEAAQACDLLLSRMSV